MIVIALVAVGLALVELTLQRLDIHIHDTHFWFGSPP
jgi:hypothetical protein